MVGALEEDEGVQRGPKAGQGVLGEGVTSDCPGVFPTRPPPCAGHQGAWQRTEAFGQPLFFML